MVAILFPSITEIPIPQLFTSRIPEKSAFPFGKQIFFLIFLFEFFIFFTKFGFFFRQLNAVMFTEFRFRFSFAIDV